MEIQQHKYYDVSHLSQQERLELFPQLSSVTSWYYEGKYCILFTNRDGSVSSFSSAGDYRYRWKQRLKIEGYTEVVTRKVLGEL